MHIPDSAISPMTSLAAGAAMAPIWSLAGRRLGDSLGTRRVPLLAVGSAFCFTVMLFNIPVAGGTTVHPLGGVLLAVLLGPWAAVVGVSVALLMQALFFADGGILAYGANCLAMAAAMPFTGWLSYRLACGRSPSPWRHSWAAAVGAYVGINAAALVVAVMLGIQPALAHTPDGRALYFPFDLRVTVPALMASHATVAGFAEAAATLLAVRWLMAAGVPLHDAGGRAARPRSDLAWAGLAALLALSPLGLLARGEAWGEWDAQGIRERAGYLPPRLAAVEERGWKGLAVLPDYLSDRGPLLYMLAGAAGAMLAAGTALLVGRAARRRDDPAAPAPPDPGPPPPADGLPAWLATPAAPDESGSDDRPPLRCASGRFLDRTLEFLAVEAREVLFEERHARTPGVLQGIDPRHKIAGIAALLLAAGLVSSPLALGVLWGFALLLARLSRLPAAVLLRRAGVPAVFFGAVAALPAMLSPVTPGPAVLTLWAASDLSVTAPGLAAAVVILLRTAAAASLGVLLACTTPWAGLVAGLRGLLLPAWLAAVLTLTHRSLAVVSALACDLFTARRSRTLCAPGARQGRAFVGAAMGGLFAHCLALAEDVHAAMVARGWAGEARTLRPLRAGFRDAAWLACALAWALIALGVDAVA